MSPETRTAPASKKRSEDHAESSCCGGHNHAAGHPTGADEGSPVAITTGVAAAHSADEAEDGVSKAILSMDNLGIIASIGCLIHCAALPFVVAFLPVLGLGWLDSHESHQYLAALIIGFALFAVVPAYFRHRRIEVLLAMIVGMTLVVAGAVFVHHIAGDQWELPLMIAGNLILVAAHWRNKMLVKCCGHEH